VHNLSTCFVLGYHGCDRETGERLLLNEPFHPQREQLRLAQCRDLLLGSESRQRRPTFKYVSEIPPIFTVSSACTNAISHTHCQHERQTTINGGRDFFTERSIEQLADDQGIEPLNDPGTFAGGWPADQDIDAFLEEIYSSR